ncbi:MAG TPA: MupA/Atu3671 family FMN-dependent luciferase-like monooxygenase [Verrucomicrobiales bacterium]|nr:MupA/Atu3671 family FMN-dependent luciferase-like monooxygenase [Verrucomicrobiales bacterium]
MRSEFLAVFFGNPGGDPCEDSCRLLLEAARFADAEGFEAVWTPERHFAPFGGLYACPAITSAAVITATQRIAVRAGSVTLPLHDAIRVAEEWAMLDRLSGGRVGVSFASGWHDRDFALAPDRYARRREIMAEQIREVRRLWRGESVVRCGGSGRETELRIFPRPLRGEIPVWVTAAGTEETFRRAGEWGAGVLTHMLGQNWNRLPERIAVYRKARETAGLDPAAGNVTLMLHTWVGEERRILRKRVEPVMRRYIEESFSLLGDAASAWEHGAYRHASRPPGDRAADPLRGLTPGERAQIVECAFERYFEDEGLFGSAEEAGEVVARARAAGVDEIACLIDFGLPEEDVLEGLRGLAEFSRGQTAARWEPGVRRSARGQQHTAVIADDATWLVVAEAWLEVLGEEPQGREAHFFDCGGNSLQAVTCAALIAERLGIEIPATLVFEHPVAWTLAAEAAQRSRDAGEASCSFSRG